MASLINIGLTGLKSHQTALATTGNNVTNANTPGYSRQETIFDAAGGQLTGAGYVGSGVNVTTISRINDEFINTQLRSDTTVFNEREALLNLSSQIDSLLASNTTGLSSSMSEFFKALQGGADDPSSVPERQLILSQSESLVSRFHALYSRLDQQSQAIEQELSASVSEVNGLASGIAELNAAISIAAGAGQGDTPNTLLDERDELLRQLSEKVTVSVLTQSDNQVSVFIGKGQPLVINNNFNELSVVSSQDDATRSDVTINIGGNSQVITGDLTGGTIGGALEFRDSILEESINNMGLIAIVVADTMNEQHQLGMDLENNLGGFFFTDINDSQLMSARVTGGQGNMPPLDRVVGVEIVDSGQLTTDEYELQFGGPTASDYRIINNSSGNVVTQGVLPGFFPASIELDGFAINLESGTFQVGDKFLIQPTRYGARDFDLDIDRVEAIAFASPIRTEASLGNTGSAVISQGVMLDVTNPATNQPLSTFSVPGQLTPPMAVRFINETLYEVLDVSDPANPVPLNPPLNNQKYVPGLSNDLFTSDSGQTVVSANGADIAQMPVPLSPATFDNGYQAQNLTIFSRDPDTGVVTSQSVAVLANESADTIAAKLSATQGVTANSYSQATVRNIDAADAITLNGEVLTVTAPAVYSPDELETVINNNANLQQLGIYAVSDGNNLTIKSSLGVDLEFDVTAGSIDLDKVNPYNNTVTATQTVNAGFGVAVGGFLDVTMDDGVTLFADTETVFQQAPPAQSSYRGFQMDVKGEPKAGDMFTIGYNTGGFSDNRNALGMVKLETSGTVGGGVSTYNEAYSKLVEEVGTFTNQARLDTEASKVLLSQSVASWNEVSGVNLDEEAGRLIQYQAAYNASAQVISVARDLFNTLLGIF